MKRTVFFRTTALVGALCSLGMSGCTDDNEGAKVSAIGVKEAVYVSPIMQLSLKDNATLQLTPFIMPQNAANKTVTYSNLHPELLTISADGLITARGIGTDTITIRATDGSGVKVSYPVKIIDHFVKATAINVTALGANMLVKIGKTFDLGATVTLAADTWDKTVIYKSSNENIATVTAAGIVSGVAEGNAVITITTADGSNISRDCNLTVQGLVIRDVDYDRSAWTATVDPANAALNDGTVGGDNPMYLLDNGSIEGRTAESCLCVAKPGRTAPLLSEDPTTFKVSFVIDMKAAQDIDYFIIRHRSDNRTVALQVWEASFYGSNDGTTFTLIKAGALTRAAVNNDPYTGFPDDTPPNYTNLPAADDPKLNVKIELDAPVNYRYIKMTYDVWNTKASGQMQIAEFNIGKTVIE